MPAVPKHKLIPTEEQEMMALAGWLDAINALWVHPANESKRPTRERMTKGGNVVRYCPQGQRLKRMGMKPGIPDVLIFSAPLSGWNWEIERNHTGIKGVAIELKRKDKSLGRLSDNQAQWISALRECGWLCNAFYGADAAIDYLKSLGYGVR